MATNMIHFLQSIFPPGVQGMTGAAWQPAVDVYRTATGWLLKFDLAGVRPEDIDVNVSGSRLTVRGQRRDWSTEKGCRCYRLAHCIPRLADYCCVGALRMMCWTATTVFGSS